MKVAIPIWNRRISPLFDTAQRVLIVELDGEQEVARTEEQIGDVALPQKAGRLTELGARVLICGAISRPLAEMLSAAGIEVVPFITGEVEEVLKAYVGGGLPAPQFLMPGCCGRRFRFRGGCR